MQLHSTSNWTNLALWLLYDTFNYRHLTKVKDVQLAEKDGKTKRSAYLQDFSQLYSEYTLCKLNKNRNKQNGFF